MRILYLDCFSGISGDMILGALLDLGADKESFLKELKKLNLDDEYDINIYNTKRSGIEATKVDVVLKNHHHHGRYLCDIEKIIDASSLSNAVKSFSKGVFKKVADAEATVHGMPVDEVHFHEVGAVDSIVDIVGCAILVDMLKADCIMSSTICEGTGFVECAHGIMPVPVPATLEILKTYNIPFKITDSDTELITPTGAAIAAFYVKEFANMPAMDILCIGYGAGTKELKRPNLLRCVLGETRGNICDEIFSLETSIDNMTGEMAGYVMEKAFLLGARDVYFTSIYMKKNRPGINLTVLCDEEKVLDMEKMIFSETPSIGIRKIKLERTIMDRKCENISTVYGDIGVKYSQFGGITKANPEYEDCRNAAIKNNAALNDVYKEVFKNI